jgi:RHS repeat-associated protein
VLPTGAAYAQVYVANERNVPVWFDDVTIEHWPGLQVQEQHYDPFGLELAGLSRSTPGLRTLNQYQWNGKEKQSDFGLGWTHLDWRFFDAQTGRFHTVDPLSDAGQEMWSTYQFGFDNAVRYNDPDGRQAGGPGDPPTDIVNRSILGLGISMFNVAAQGYAAVTGANEKWVADYAYDSEGTAVDYAYHKEPIGSAGQEAKSFGLDALNIGLSLYGGGGEAKLYEQAAGKVVASEAVQAGKAAVQQGKAASPITGYTNHGLNQAIGRNGGKGVNAKAMRDAVTNPKKVVNQANGTTKYTGGTGKDATTVVTNSEGKVVTTFGKARGVKTQAESRPARGGAAPGGGAAQRRAIRETGANYNPRAIH